MDQTLMPATPRAAVQANDESPDEGAEHAYEDRRQETVGIFSSIISLASTPAISPTRS